jgi:hypothetical protein
MVLPTAIASRELAAGDLPVWSPLYFQGESLLNPHSQLLYPPWWATFLPIDLPSALKLVLVAHFVAAPLVVYWYTRRAELPIPVAAGLAAAAAMPLAGLSWHHQKTLGWPWLLLVACQLLPWEWQRARRAGAIVGLSGGALLLASSLYFAWYAALLVAPLFVLYRGRERWLAAIAGATVGLPAIVLNLLPYLGSPRPAPGWWLTPRTLVAGLTGVGSTERVRVLGVQVSGVPFEGYAVVGLGVVLLGAAGFAHAVQTGRRRWGMGVAAGGTIGLVLSMHPGVYLLPVVGTFRTAGRADVMIALAALVFAVYACRVLLAGDGSLPELPGVDPPVASRWLVVGLTALLVANAATGAVAWQSFDRGDGTDLAESEAFADGLPDDCGDEVWAEMYQDDESIPRGHLGMALLRAGYTLDGVYYASMTFDLLVAPARIDGSTPLTGGSAQVTRGAVARDELRSLGARTYRGERVFVYARRGACSGQ